MEVQISEKTIGKDKVNLLQKLMETKINTTALNYWIIMTYGLVSLHRIHKQQQTIYTITQYRARNKSFVTCTVRTIR